VSRPTGLSAGGTNAFEQERERGVVPTFLEGLPYRDSRLLFKTAHARSPGERHAVVRNGHPASRQATDKDVVCATWVGCSEIGSMSRSPSVPRWRRPPVRHRGGSLYLTGQSCCSLRVSVASWSGRSRVGGVFDQRGSTEIERRSSSWGALSAGNTDRDEKDSAGVLNSASRPS
jgi:hypothetical protein